MKISKVIYLFVYFLFQLFHCQNSIGETLYVLDKSTSEVSKKTSFIKQKQLDSVYSSKKLGSFIEGDKTLFRLFAPNATEVILHVYDNPQNEISRNFPMTHDNDGVWEVIVEENLKGKYYGYRVAHIDDKVPIDFKPLCVDPYSKAVATYNTFMNPRKSIVYDENYNWENDSWIQRDWRDLIIYETHVRDMTAHPTSGSKNPGTYKGLVEKGIPGGIDYIKSLGINTVELLPSQEFGNMEIPFMDSLAGKFNTWNPYERNHWGYMTAAFFAPAAYYAEDWSGLKRNTWMGTSGNQVTEFKNMVKAFHKEGIAVIMDVVYNHLSEYEIGNLKQIDKEYYFRLNEDGSYIAQSGCGNDLKTERLMMRRMIIESILFWMHEYHIDGFRFDLGKLIDWETIEDIIYEAQKINPNVVFVCEPWGGGYDPQGFSVRGWGAWNDQIRNGIKGENPNDGLGWIFGNWYGNNSIQRIKSYVNGTLTRDSLGLFQKKEHSVNYLESHDGYTLGDFIRIGTDEVDKEEVIVDININAAISPHQMKLNKLGALFLFTSQGITMIHSGQEFARSKVIPFEVTEPDEDKGMIDHNTYNKDNAVNYINYHHAEINKELVDYYKGLIALRNEYKAFRHAKYESIFFIEKEGNQFALGYELNSEGQHFIVLFNANPSREEIFELPKGKWEILVNESSAGIDPLNTVTKKYVLPPTTGAVLKLK
ncbi:MAG: alpha-amylase family glycosyl hydrolase [bacterium]